MFTFFTFFLFAKLKKWDMETISELLIESGKKKVRVAKANYDHLLYCHKRVKKNINNYSFYLKIGKTALNGTGKSSVLIPKLNGTSGQTPSQDGTCTQDLGTSVVVVAVHICIR